MAITIQSTPQDYSSAQDDLIFTVAEVAHTADPVTYPNYKFIADVYVGLVLVARIKVVPRPDTKIGIFNIGQIVRNYVSARFDPLTSSVLAQVDGDGIFKTNVTVKFGEEYAYTAYYDLTVDSERVYFNYYNRRGEVLVLTNHADGFTTDRPASTPVRCDSIMNLVPFWPFNTSLHTITITTYGSDGNVVRSEDYEFIPGETRQMINFNFSKQALNTEYGDFINDNVEYYDIANGSEVLTFTNQCECQYETFTPHFLNKYGGWESKDFAKVSRRTISIEKKDFGKLPYIVDSSGVVSYRSANGVYNESRSVYSSIYKEKMTLNSDLLTDAEYRWLEQLVISPMVYIEQLGEYFPCVLTESNYEPKKIVNDDLTNLTISIEYGESINAQFR